MAEKNGDIEFSQMISTKMSCQMIEQEQHFVELLQQANNYKLDDNQLELYFNKLLLLRFIEDIE